MLLSVFAVEEQEGCSGFWPDDVIDGRRSIDDAEGEESEEYLSNVVVFPARGLRDIGLDDTDFDVVCTLGLILECLDAVFSPEVEGEEDGDGESGRDEGDFGKVEEEGRNGEGGEQDRDYSDPVDTEEGSGLHEGISGAPSVAEVIPRESAGDVSTEEVSKSEESDKSGQARRTVGEESGKSRSGSEEESE